MRHRFHSICPYFAMFPEEFVQKHIVWSEPGDIVLDPFAGRGTTVFQALLSDRNAIGGDTNSVAVCVSRAKADPPRMVDVLSRIDDLERSSRHRSRRDPSIDGDNGEFFDLCFHHSTLRQVSHLREQLRWKRSRVDAFIAALALGVLHGESHKTEWCFSNRMPRTISTKPAYSVRWWKEHGLVAPARDVFDILRGVALYRYASPLPDRRGRVAHCDARKLHTRFPNAFGKVSLVVTSPPYLDTTDYVEDQWLRLWFLGGPARPQKRPNRDDRHRAADEYWTFLTEAWVGIRPLLARDAHMVIRIGGKRVAQDDAERGLKASLKAGLSTRVRLVDRWSSSIVGGQVQSFRPGAEGIKMEHDFHFRLS
jgi:DNA methylase